jgi:hypothetical protein
MVLVWVIIEKDKDCVLHGDQSFRYEFSIVLDCVEGEHQTLKQELVLIVRSYVLHQSRCEVAGLLSLREGQASIL